MTPAMTYQSFSVYDRHSLVFQFTSSVNTSVVLYYIFQGIGLTKVSKIRSADTASYKALATSSHVYKDEVRNE